MCNSKKKSTHAIGIAVCLAVALALPVAAVADDLTRIAQEELTTLGYDVGPADGQMGTQTAVAISSFQAEQGMEVTGEVSPQLVGILKAEVKKQTGGAAATAASAPETPQTDDLQARQQACLQAKVEAAQAQQKSKRADMKILNTISRNSSRYGTGEMAQKISTASGHVYNADATVDDIESVAKDLGISNDDVIACRDPS
jgi:peptidoglycan hydrolase-like protein with peptidoglycan-binding domain